MTTPVQNKWSQTSDALKNFTPPDLAGELGQWIGSGLSPQTNLLDKIQQFFLQKNIALNVDDSYKILDGINKTMGNTNQTENPDLKNLLANHKALKVGTDAKEEIGQLQDALRKLGYNIDDQNGKYRGVFGKQTKDAVKKFQMDYDLAVDGSVGKKTLSTLISALDHGPSMLQEIVSKKIADTEGGIKDSRLPDGILRKPTAKIGAISKEVKATLPIIIEVFKKHGLPAPVITSGNDSNHLENSRHYKNQAIDIRGKHLPNNLMKKIAEEIQEKVGGKYDVLSEFFANPSNDHIHIEYDPK